jgi:hypothetical protein
VFLLWPEIYGEKGWAEKGKRGIDIYMLIGKCRWKGAKREHRKLDLDYNTVTDFFPAGIYLCVVLRLVTTVVHM